MRRVQSLLRARAAPAAGGTLVFPLAGSGGRLRRHRVRLHDPRGREAHLRAFDPDAQPRQRQGRRDRRLRAGAGRIGRVAQGARGRLHSPGRPAGSRRPGRGGKGLHRALLRHRPGRPDPHRGRLPRRAAAGGPAPGRGPLFRPRQACRARAFRRGEEAGRGGPFRAGGGRRVRLPELDRAEQPVLRLAGRQAGVRAVPRAEPDHSQDRRLRRGRRAVLPHARHARPRLDRPPAVSRRRAACGIRAERIRSSG